MVRAVRHAQERLMTMEGYPETILDLRILRVRLELAQLSVQHQAHARLPDLLKIAPLHRADHQVDHMSQLQDHLILRLLLQADHRLA